MATQKDIQLTSVDNVKNNADLMNLLGVSWHS